MRSISLCLAAAISLLFACSSGDDGGNKGFNTAPNNTAGSNSASGGSTASAGTSTTPSAGTEANGGSSTGGSSVVPSGGMSSEAGSGGSTASAGAGGMSTPPAGPSAVLKSSGCGKPLPANQVKTVTGSRTGYTEYHVKQTGETITTAHPEKAVDRQFFVRVNQ